MQREHCGSTGDRDVFGQHVWRIVLSIGGDSPDLTIGNVDAIARLQIRHTEVARIDHFEDFGFAFLELEEYSRTDVVDAVVGITLQRALSIVDKTYDL